MAWSDFYITGTGDNTNAGSTTSNTAAVSVTNSDWGSVTANRFTASAGTPFASVAIGDWASVYNDGAAATGYTAQVTAVNGGGVSIDLSATNKMGTAPTTAASGKSCKTGGGWADFG